MLSVMLPACSYCCSARRCASFYDKWRDNALVVDKWFALQAAARYTTVQTARDLMTHPAFTLRNPNRARALVFQFCLNNARGMHHPDGSGYTFWACLLYTSRCV